jgi:hypothetical protein
MTHGICRAPGDNPRVGDEGGGRMGAELKKNDMREDET